MNYHLWRLPLDSRCPARSPRRRQGLEFNGSRHKWQPAGQCMVSCEGHNFDPGRVGESQRGSESRGLFGQVSVNGMMTELLSISGCDGAECGPRGGGGARGSGRSDSKVLAAAVRASHKEQWQLRHVWHALRVVQAPLPVVHARARHGAHLHAPAGLVGEVGLAAVHQCSDTCPARSTTLATLPSSNSLPSSCCLSASLFIGSSAFSCARSCRSWCEPGITRRQPFSSVESSTATHTVHVARGARWANTHRHDARARACRSAPAWRRS